MNTKLTRKPLLQLNKQGIINGFRALKRLMSRSGPSEEHKIAWANFDMVLMIRANAGHTMSCTQFAGWFIFGGMPY